MWTNVFKIDGFQTVSWFQFRPYEQDPSSQPENGSSLDQRDPATFSILSSHLQLQNEGFLSTWTSSFVGPWDPSQGTHNPDEKIKLWLFLPGYYSAISESACAFVSHLKVIGHGVWSAPGDSEEVGLAFAQCLRNRIERSLRALNFVRFGDVFTKCHPFPSSEKNFRRAQPSCELIFLATYEAIFVHVLVSSKHICSLPGEDVKRALKYYNGKNGGLPVICSPNGLRGRLVGICPADLVNQVYLSESKSSNDSSGSSSRLKEQSCCVEVAVGCTSLSVPNPAKSASHFVQDNSQMAVPKKLDGVQFLSEGVSPLERTLIYPVEAVVVPLLYKAFSRCSPKRFWLHNQLGTVFSDAWTLRDSSETSTAIKSLGLESAAFMESINDDFDESVLKLQRSYNSSSNSKGSSRSSISSTSSGSDNITAVGSHDLEADADSVTCAQSGLSVNDQAENNSRKMVSKRPRAGSTVSTEAMQGMYKSELSMVEANSSVSEAVTTAGIGAYWDFTDDDGDYGINIQTLLSEFGDFGDFFVNDILCFGEPPGTAESQTLNVASDGSDSPSTAMVNRDQMLIEGLHQVPYLTRFEENGHRSSAISSDEFRRLSKAEAALTFAPEYAAVVTATGESAPIFRTAYVPLSQKGQFSVTSSGNYSYNATPPRLIEASEEKSVVPPCYTQIERGRKFSEKNADLYLQKENPALSSVSGITSSPSQRSHAKKIESASKFDVLKTSLATEAECMMLQSSMCRIRHTLLSNAKQNHSSDLRLSRRELVPVRIAGDLDIQADDKAVRSAVGVWRSVGTAKASKSVDVFEDSSSLNVQLRHVLELLLDALPLVVQQSTSFVDVAHDSCDGEEPYSWLAFQEQQRRGFSCGPSMSHAGCGGLLAACHSMDISGIELEDPLSADVQASIVTTFLQSDIKTALRNAFGKLEGPLSLMDFCKSRYQPSDSQALRDGLSVDSFGGEHRDSSSTPRDGSSVGEPAQRRAYNESSTREREQLSVDSRIQGTISLIPFPAILVGYQDDWLKTSSSSLEIWEKGPLEPYALPKHITYHAICPDIDLLSYSASDFFLQLGTVYETCKLGSHLPHGSGGQTDPPSGKSSSGLTLIECPPSLKGVGRNISSISSVSDFFVALETGWDVSSYLKALSNVLKNLKLGSSGVTQKEIKGGSCTVVYVVCPFPEPAAVLQTVVEASSTLGSSYFSADKERRSWLHSQVTKALSCASSFDEASTSSLLALSGFSMSKLVLQIVTVNSLLRVKPGNELNMFKEYAFTVYNKARRVPRSFGGTGGASLKENLDSRWDGSSWPALRNVDGALPYHDDIRFLFEPLFILAEPSGAEQAVSCLSSPGAEDVSAEVIVDGAEIETRAPSLHCCYGWTEDWRWMVCIWTDSRGELLDSQVFPFGGISSRQDTKLLQCLFVQMLQHGCHILSCCSYDSGSFRPRDLVISRIGSFFELERQEWQRAIYLVGGNEVKKWAVQLRGQNGAGLPMQQDLMPRAERPLPSSPSSLYSSHAKMSYIKPGTATQVGAKKPVLFQFLQSITLVSVLVDHSLQLMLPAADSASSAYVEGFSPVKSVGAMQGAYIIIPSRSLRHLPTTPLQLPTSLTSESPPLAHLLHSKGPSLPITSAFVVSKTVPSGRSSDGIAKEEWPSVLLVGLVDHCGNVVEKPRGKRKAEYSDVLETVAAELHALSWMTVSPLYPRRRTPLPLHCDVLLRLRRLLYFADRELLSRPVSALSP